MLTHHTATGKGPEAAGNEWTLCLRSPGFKACSSYISNIFTLPAQRRACLGSSLAFALTSSVTVGKWPDFTEFCLPQTGNDIAPASLSYEDYVEYEADPWLCVCSYYYFKCLISFYLCVLLPACMYVCHTYSRRSGEGIQSSGPGVKMIVSHHVSAGSQPGSPVGSAGALDG